METSVCLKRESAVGNLFTAAVHFPLICSERKKIYLLLLACNMYFIYVSVSFPQVEYKRGHEERVSKFTSVADTPDILHAKAGGQLASDVSGKKHKLIHF